MARDFKASRSAVLISDLRFWFRFCLPDALAGVALAALILILPVLGALL